MKKVHLIISIGLMFVSFNCLAEDQWLASFEAINTGNTAWMMLSTIVVLFMTVPGLALFYAGMTRKQNMLSTMMQSFSIVGVVAVIWFCVGYTLVFVPAIDPTINSFIGGLNRIFLSGAEIFTANKQLTIFPEQDFPELVWIAFQMTFAIISAAIIAGSLVERIKFSALLVFVSFWVLLVYVPTAHWVWGGGFLDALMVKIFNAPIYDFAGGTVVHINAGIAGLVGALVLGARSGHGKEAMPPHNLSLTLTGAAFLWFGWFGFNAGSAGAADAIAALALINTLLAAAVGGLTWILAEQFSKHKPSSLGIASGILAGLVGITPAAGFVSPLSSIFIGILTTIVCFIAVTIVKHKLKYDDTLDAFGIHGVGGVIGALLVYPFFSDTINTEPAAVFTVQLLGVVVTVVYGLIIDFILFKAIDKTIGLRVTKEEELQGLDLSLHGERIL